MGWNGRPPPGGLGSTVGMLLWLLLSGPASAEAQALEARAVAVPRALAVTGPIGTAEAPVTDLKFSEVFKLPVGPAGLEPSAKLLALVGHPVRIVGYMVSRETAVPGQLLLSPLPVQIGDEDESFSDDLPPSAVAVHLAPAFAAQAVPNLRGLMHLSGVLRVGAFDEPDGRIANVRLELDDAQSQLLPRITLQAAGEVVAR